MKKMSEAGTKPILVAADVSNAGEVAAMFAQVLSEYGRIDYLINNAGIQIAEDTEKLAVEDFDKVLAVNLRGAFLCAQQAVRHFLDSGRGGSSSTFRACTSSSRSPASSAIRVEGRHAELDAYAGARVRGARRSGQRHRPGCEVTPINRSWIDDPVKREAVESHIPMRRAGDAEEMAAVTAFLCSDEAAYISGQTIFVDGGLTLYPSFETTWSSE